VQCSQLVRDLLPTEWAVLGLLCHRPQHGFALSKSLSHDGVFGYIWTAPRPLTYRAIDTLCADGLVEFQGAEPGEGGPPRHVVEITDRGRDLLGEWLNEPVTHVRDARSQLLLKLAIIDDLDRDPAPLIAAQLGVVEAMEHGLETQMSEAAVGNQEMVFAYRLEIVRGFHRFLEQRATQIDGHKRLGA